VLIFVHLYGRLPNLFLILQTLFPNLMLKCASKDCPPLPLNMHTFWAMGKSLYQWHCLIQANTVAKAASQMLRNLACRMLGLLEKNSSLQISKREEESLTPSGQRCKLQWGPYIFSKPPSANLTRLAQQDVPTTLCPFRTVAVDIRTWPIRFKTSHLVHYSNYHFY